MLGLRLFSRRSNVPTQWVGSGARRSVAPHAKSPEEERDREEDKSGERRKRQEPRRRAEGIGTIEHVKTGIVDHAAERHDADEKAREPWLVEVEREARGFDAAVGERVGDLQAL